MLSFEKGDFLYSCLVCGNNDKSKLQTMRISRRFLGCQDSVTSFDICDDCIVEMWKDLDKIIIAEET